MLKLYLMCDNPSLILNGSINNMEPVKIKHSLTFIQLYYFKEVQDIKVIINSCSYLLQPQKFGLRVNNWFLLFVIHILSIE